MNKYSPDISDGFIKWTYDVWRMDTATFFQFAGLDALVFRMYLKGCVYMCLVALPYALCVLLPVYATGKNGSHDALQMFTVSNVASDSSRMYATVIGAYVSFAIALYYLSKIYLVVAYAADQNYVGNAGNVRSLKQIDKMSWFSYYEAVMSIIQFNVNVVTTGLVKVKGAVGTIGTIVQQATKLQHGTKDETDKTDNVNDTTKDENEINRSSIEAFAAETDTTSLLKAGSYGSVDDNNESEA